MGVVLASNLYSALASAILILHALFIVWAIFGALFNTRAPYASMVAHRFSCVGSSNRSTTVAVSIDTVRKLA